jgi:cytochrome c biogenesis protein CcmG/thiol:disulfide interchange protein DsbE
VLTETRLVPVGTPAPEWSLANATDPTEKLSLGDYQGKVVVLDFWSVGCPPCIRELNELESIYRQFQSRGVEVVGVAAWGESSEDVRDLNKARDVSYPLVLGTSSVVNAYRATSLPTLYIIDEKGRIAASHQGFWPREGIADTLSKVLDKPRR